MGWLVGVETGDGVGGWTVGSAVDVGSAVLVDNDATVGTLTAKGADCSTVLSFDLAGDSLLQANINKAIPASAPGNSVLKEMLNGRFN